VLGLDLDGRQALWAIGLVDAALIAAVAYDLRATPDPARLDVRRGFPRRAGLSRDVVRTLRVDAGSGGGRGAGGLELELREEFSRGLEVRARTVLTDALGPRARATPADDVRPFHGAAAPVAADPTGGPDAVRLPASGPIDLVRVYASRRRGLQWVGDLRLRLTGPLGLVQRQARLAGRRTVAVDPPLSGLKRTLALAASHRWRDLGVRNLRRVGGMTEFESLREHVVGDDVRLVDWKAFAKRGVPIVRQFQEERGQELVILFDCGRRMGATSGEDAARTGTGTGTDAGARRLHGWTKLDHALDAGLELAAVALQEGDRVGVLAFDDDVRAWVVPARGRAQLGRLREAVFALEPSRQEADLARALRGLALRHPRRALLVLLSDVADPLSVERQARALSAGSRQHRVVFAGLDDPSLRRAADGSLAVAPAVRAAALALVEERRAGVGLLKRSGARVLDTLPAETAGPLLASWLDARRSGSF
jgi:uncharacterized protein (DUF58 family)